jgi:hypothetical protein
VGQVFYLALGLILLKIEMFDRALRCQDAASEKSQSGHTSRYLRLPLVYCVYSGPPHRKAAKFYNMRQMPSTDLQPPSVCFGGVGARSGTAGESIGVECAVDRDARAPNEALHVAQTAWDAERAEVEKLGVELSSAFETRGAELEALRLKLAEVEKEASTAAATERSRMESAQQVVALTDQAHTASARAHIAAGPDWALNLEDHGAPFLE